jgi:hypothetical protein
MVSVLLLFCTTRPNNKIQWQGAQEDPKQKQDRAQGRARAGKPLHKNK